MMYGAAINLLKNEFLFLQYGTANICIGKMINIINHLPNTATDKRTISMEINVVILDTYAILEVLEDVSGIYSSNFSISNFAMSCNLH